MKRKLQLTFLFLVIALTSKSQTKLDSLYGVWQDKKQSDSIRVEAYYKYIWDGFLQKKPDKAIQLAENLMAFTKDKNYPRGNALALKILGASSFYKKDYNQALRYNNASLNAFKALKDTVEMAKAIGNIGLVYRNTGDNKNALDYYKRSLSLYQKAANKTGIARTLSSIGFTYYRLKNNREALDYFIQCLKVYEDIGGDQTNVVSTLTTIGQLYRINRQPKEAIAYFLRIKKIHEETDAKEKLAGILIDIGVLHNRQEEFNEALGYIEESLKIYHALDNSKGVLKAKQNIWSVFWREDRREKGVAYLTQRLKDAEKRGNESEIALRKSILGEFYLQVGANYDTKGNYPLALKYFNEAVNFYEEIAEREGVGDAYNNMANIYLSQGNNILALKYFEQSLSIYEEIDDKFRIAANFTGIGNLYLDMKNYSSALDYYTKANTLSQQIQGHEDLKIAVLGNLGMAHVGLKNVDQAILFSEKAIKKADSLPAVYYRDQLIAKSLSTLGNTYLLKNDYDRAIEYFNKAFTMQEQGGYKSNMASSLQALGNCYLKKENYTRGIALLKKGLALAEEMKLLLLQKEIHQSLYDAYKNLKKGNLALASIEKLRVLEDSISSQEMGKKLQQMEFAKQVTKDSLATVEKERKIEMAHQEEVRKKNQTQNVLYGVAAFILLIAGGIYSRLRYVRKSKAIIEKEKDRSENLLLNILPAEIAEELKIKGKADARDFDMVSILFTDFKGFTEQSAKLSAADLVNEINTCFEAFDGIMETYGIEKIKTIGDAYMAAGGLPVPKEDSIKNTVLAAFAMQDFIEARKHEMDTKGLPSFQMRVGIHTGPVVAGIVGVKKFQYDIWGDTVNTASRMESNGVIGKVNISETTYNFLKNEKDLTFESRGKIEAKGKGEINMYFVSKALS